MSVSDLSSTHNTVLLLKSMQYWLTTIDFSVEKDKTEEENKEGEKKVKKKLTKSEKKRKEERTKMRKKLKEKKTKNGKKDNKKTKVNTNLKEAKPRSED